MNYFLKESKMLHKLLRINNICASKYLQLGSRFSHQITLSENQAEFPEYPPIIDTSDKGQDRYFRGIWYDSVKSLPSVEQKLYELAIQQKLDLKTYNLCIVPPMYNGIYYSNYITRTHLIHNLPNQFTSMNVDKELSEIREVLCETLLDHYCNVWKEKKFRSIYDYLSEKSAGSQLVQSLILQCYKKLALKNDYVLNSTVS